MDKEKSARQERIEKLQRAIKLGYEYEKTYTDEMEVRKEIRQKQEKQVKEFINMTDEEYLKNATA